MLLDASEADGDLLEAAKKSVAMGRETGGVLKGILWHQGESDCGSAHLNFRRVSKIDENH